MLGRDPVAKTLGRRTLELDMPRFRADLVARGTDLPPDGDQLIGQPSHLHRPMTCHGTTLTRSNRGWCRQSVAKLRPATRPYAAKGDEVCRAKSAPRWASWTLCGRSLIR